MPLPIGDGIKIPSVKFKVEDKVKIPTRKSTGTSINHMYVQAAIKANTRGYSVITRVDKDDFIDVCIDPSDSNTDWTFKSSDLELYEEDKNKNMKAQPFRITGKPSLITAFREDLLAMGYCNTKDVEEQVGKSIYLGPNLGDRSTNFTKEQFTKLYGWYSFPHGNSWQSFKLPEQYNEALEFAKTQLSDKIWGKEAHRMTIGTQKAAIEIHKDKVVTVGREQNSTFPISELQDFYDQFKLNERVGDHGFYILYNVPFIRVGCSTENNLVTLNEIQNVLNLAKGL